LGFVVGVLCVCALVAVGCASPDSATSTSAAGESTRSSGLYPVSVDGKWGYIDRTGALNIQPQFDYAADFSDDLAQVAVEVDGAQEAGYIDTSGRVVFTLEPGRVPGGTFSGGIAKVNVYSNPTKAPDSMAYIDTTGKVIWQGEQ
jgi:hypothetical protein